MHSATTKPRPTRWLPRPNRSDAGHQPVWQQQRVQRRKDAEGELHALKTLRVGKEAPEIKAGDLDGKEFKLSDYRGKVVLLDFWGHGEAACRAMYPHERSLVKKMADKPFASVGVNSDKDLGCSSRFWKKKRSPGGRSGMARLARAGPSRKSGTSMAGRRCTSSTTRGHSSQVRWLAGR